MNESLPGLGAHSAKRILSIDPSLTACGVAVLDIGDDYALGDKAKAPLIRIAHQIVLGYGMKNAQERHKEERIDEIAAEIVDIAKRLKPDAVVMEGPAFQANGMVFDLGGLHFHLRIKMRKAGFPIRIIPISAGRKAVIGSGRIPKSFTIAGKKPTTKQWIEVSLRDQHGIGMENEHLNDCLITALAFREGVEPSP